MPRLDDQGRPHWTYVVWCLFWGAAFLFGAGLAVKWMRASLDSWSFTYVGLAIMAGLLVIGIAVDSRSRSRGRGEGPGA